MPSTEEIREHEAKYGITAMGAYLGDLRSPTRLGDLVVVSWTDHVAVVDAAVAEAEQRVGRRREPLDKAVWLLKSIGLDITYTDEGLEVIAKQIMRMGEQQAYDSDDWVPWRNANFAAGLDAAREAVAALPWNVAVSFGPIDCDQSCEHGPCTCSGVMRPEAWTLNPADALAAIAALRGES